MSDISPQQIERLRRLSASTRITNCTTLRPGDEWVEVMLFMPKVLDALQAERDKSKKLQARWDLLVGLAFTGGES